MVAGTVALGLLDAIVRVMPVEGAAPESVTVAVELVPPETADGAKAIPCTVIGVTVSVVVLVVDPWVAVIVATAVEPTLPVVAVNVAVDAPALTVTVLGTVTAALLEVRFTVIPPV